MKILLLGYMGSGKTTIGEQLALSLNYKFIDLDHAIELQEESSISKLFSTKGEIYFRKTERKVLETLISNHTNIVIATGGGTPCFGDAMDYLNSLKDTLTVYLKASNEELTSRLFNEKNKRPLISHIETEELLNDFIKKHLFERSYYYNQSEIIQSINNKPIQEIVEEIKNKINC